MSKKEKQPLELILKEKIEKDETIEASFERLFKVGNYYYAALLNKENHLFLLKVINEPNGTITLNNIVDEYEFSYVQATYQEINSL